MQVNTMKKQTNKTKELNTALQTLGIIILFIILMFF